jgi:hypothetical protein
MAHFPRIEIENEFLLEWKCILTASLVPLLPAGAIYAKFLHILVRKARVLPQ